MNMKALPPWGTSERAKIQNAVAKIQDAVDLLLEEGAGQVELNLLAAIAQSPILSDECFFRFLDTGFAAAIELYNSSNFAYMASSEEVAADPDNPQNWVGYENHLENKKKFYFLDEQQLATYNSLVESYQELVAKAGTNNPNVLADLANKGNNP